MDEKDVADFLLNHMIIDLDVMNSYYETFKEDRRNEKN